MLEFFPPEIVADQRVKIFYPNKEIKFGKIYSIEDVYEGSYRMATITMDDNSEEFCFISLFKWNEKDILWELHV